MVIDFVIRELEFNSVLEILSKLALSDQGKKIIEQLTVFDNYDQLLKEQQKLLAITTLFGKGKKVEPAGAEYFQLPAFFSFDNCLTASELLILHKNYTITKNIQSSVKGYPVLEEELNHFYTIDDWDKDMSKMISDEGTVKENATDTLKKLHNRARKTYEKIHSHLMGIIETSREIIMEPVVTKRADRYVIPVKRDFKGRIKCLVHDVSGTGSTVFVEPISVVDLNNDYLNILKNIQIEETKILLALSKTAIENKRLFDIVDHIVGTFDSLSARYKFGKKYNFKIPEISKKKEILMKNAGHPLLIFQQENKDVVRNDIYLNTEHRNLIISGSNTGGKTVFLKTCGLLQLMNQAAIPVPVNEDSRFYIFKNILTDIGDRQSIEQSLSTFSSHLHRIKLILKKAGPDSLILIDELGTGTDPSDGAAIGRETVKRLAEQKCFSLVTTHYTDITSLAFEGHQSVRLASVEFNDEKLIPTFHLLYDVPGRSHAVDIAEKLEFEPSFVKNAREYSKSKEGKNFSEMAIGLAKKLKQQEKITQKQELELQRAEQLRKILESREKNLILEKKHLEKKLNNEFSRFIKQFRSEKEKVFRNISAKNRKTSEKLETKMKKQFQDEFLKKVELPTEPSLDFGIGDRVKHTLFGITGLIEEIKHNGESISIKSGSKTMWVASGDLELINKAAVVKKESTPGSVKISTPEKETLYFLDVNVVGKTVDDATFLIEEQLNKALLEGFDTVRVIHGHGTGRLRQGIRNWLKSLTYIENFESDQADGATIINL